MDFNLVRITKQVATSSHENCYDEVEDNLAFIKDCKSKDAFNTMGTFYATGKMVELDMNRAINYFNLSNNEMAHFNIASLISIGVISGSEADMMFHLTFCSDFPIDKLDLVKTKYVVALFVIGAILSCIMKHNAIFRSTFIIFPFLIASTLFLFISILQQKIFYRCLVYF